MAKKQQIYIVIPSGLASTELNAEPSRRRSLDGSKVILHEDDFRLYSPVINEETGEIALTLEQKVSHLGGTILSHPQAIQLVGTAEWNEEEGGDHE